MPARFWQRSLACVLFLVTASAPVRAQSTGTGSQPPEQPSPPDPPPPGDIGFRFHGYLRSGFGVDGSGAGMQAFKAPLAGAKYRLGNEAETYLEATFDYGAQSEGPKPAYFDTRITLAYVAPTSQSNSFATTFSLREAYALGRGVWESQPNAAFWAGVRFYDRHDLHISDFFYRDPSGFGGGIDNIELGDYGKFAVAWLGGSSDQLDPNGTVPTNQLYRLNKNNFDLKGYGYDTGAGQLSVALDISFFNGDEVVQTGGALPIVLNDDVGLAGTAILETPFGGARNKVVVQYGTGSAFDFKSILTPPTGRTFVPGENVDVGQLWQLRIVNDLLIEQRGAWQFQGAVVYQELDNGAASNNRVRWVSLGARPVYELSRFFSLATEAGWDHTTQSDLPGGSVFKLTVAPQLTPALKFLSRPSIRAFATWAHWSDSLRGSVGLPGYADAIRGTAVGVQMESWW